MGDHVVGPRDQFFALQQRLSEKFVTALGESLKPPAPQGGVGDVSVVLDYARGLDYLDRGDWASAERVLAGVVGQSPEFDLARKRHDEALAQLQAARKRRDELLGEGQRALLERMDTALAGDVTQVAPGRIDEWIGYRELRGQLFLKLANAQLADPPTRLTFGKVVPNDRREAFREAMTTYFQNMIALTAEMRAWKGAGHGLPTFLDVPDADENQASTLGLSSPKILRTPDEVAIELAQQVCAGQLPDAFMGSSPTLLELDPVTVPMMLGELDRALADVATFQPRYVERSTMRLLAAYGDCLLALGRKDEAVRKWQEGLDRFPTAGPSEYGDLERRIRENL
jgi:tetratricopeptide (TPR) repeat protein